jgi:hypothetical protein
MALDPPPDARDQHVRQAALHLEDLAARLQADHALEVPHDRGVGMRPHGGADAVVRGVHVRHPVAHRLVDGVLQRARSTAHGPDPRSQKFHPKHVQRLALDVLLAHVDLALEVEQGARRGRGHAVLPGAGLGDHAPLPHVAGEQHLSKRVVDLVRAGVGEIFPLQIDASPTEVVRHARREEERRGTPGVVGQQPVELGAVHLARTDARIGLLELLERRHQRLGDVTSPVGPKAPGLVRLAPHPLSSASRTASMKAAIF